MESSQPNCQHTPAAGTPAPAVEILADAWDPDLKSRLLCKELALALRFPREFACHSLWFLSGMSSVDFCLGTVTGVYRLWAQFYICNVCSHVSMDMRQSHQFTNKILKCTKIMWLPYLSINWTDSLKDTSQWVPGTILLGSVPVFCGINVSIYFTHVKFRTSLVVQWLKIHLPKQGTQVWSMFWEDPTCSGATKPMPHSCCAHLPQLLKLVCPRAHAPRESSPC